MIRISRGSSKTRSRRRQLTDLTQLAIMFSRTSVAIGMAIMLLSWGGTSVAADVVASGYKHLGAATCASSVCHGKLTPQPDRDVALNEYRIWSHDDYHSRAFRDLSNPLSQSIAAKMGLASASTAKICLDCHADNVPATERGAKFQLSDGVQCEACHGGAEKWIETHTQKGVAHSDNVARGMYPSEQPLKRAELCVSCHMGTRDKYTTHVIMGAGHPRLRFELQVYTFNQPAHVQIDADYVQRKGRIDEMNLWITGQLENARRYLELLQSRLQVPDSFLPEFALYDCFSCHHPMDKQRWSRTRAGAGIQPGTLRLQKCYLVMLQAVTEVLAPESLSELVTATDQLEKAGQTDSASVRASAQKLHDWVDAHDGWSRRAYSADEIAKIRKSLLRYAAEDKTSDYAAAEQVVLGIDGLSRAAGDHDRRNAAIDTLYNAVKSASGFDPTQFSGAARSVQGQF
jgi:Cytochrome c554 and c-prime